MQKYHSRIRVLPHHRSLIILLVLMILCILLVWLVAHYLQLQLRDQMPQIGMQMFRDLAAMRSFCMSDDANTTQELALAS